MAIRYGSLILTDLNAAKVVVNRLVCVSDVNQATVGFTPMTQILAKSIHMADGLMDTVGIPRLASMKIRN